MWGKKKRSPESDPTAIANILLKFGWVTSEQVSYALSSQQSQRDRLIGQLMVEMGYVTQEQVDHALLHQAYRRGKASHDEVSKATISRQMALSDKIIEAAKDIGESAAALRTGSYVPAKRTT